MPTYTILLVDDFEDGLDMYQEYLTYRGYRVIVARSGEEAIFQARLHRPAVILMDIRMPVMTGTDAMRVLRSDASFQGVPIIALTAQALDGERAAALGAGFDELIPKPCLPDELVFAIERIVAAARASQTIMAVDDFQAEPGDGPGRSTYEGWLPVEEHAGGGNGHYHAVRFYEDESSLYRIVTDFIGDGLVAGQPAVVIATPSHRDGIARGLRALSLDVDRLQETGELLLLDCEETLSTFMRNGSPDPVAFQKSVGDVLDSATAGRPKGTVRAYGEMVDWLWKHDAADAAIRLELLWNQLANTRAFSLLCGYSMGHFYKLGAYERICEQHTHVVSSAGHPTRIRVA